jgi:signal transduction histidine kinase/CheY-like chemotaxis protein
MVARSSPPLDGPLVSLDTVLVTEELAHRPARVPDYAAENKALLALAEIMTEPPQRIRERVVSLTQALCRADSSAVSILEEEAGKQVFCWRAVAGRFKASVGLSVPRDASPCGVVFDRNAVLLFAHPARHFAHLRTIEPRIAEVLLAPLYVCSKPIGTVWAVAHGDDRNFDAEDARLLSSLARFAAAAEQALAMSRETQLTGALLKGKKRALDMIVRGEPLPAVLEALCHIVEEQSNGRSTASILLLDADGRRLRSGAGPSLPVEYNQAIDGVTIGSNVGTCGTAAFERRVVFTPDIASDPAWVLFRHLALGLGLRAAWSMPIISSAGEVLGTFANYFCESRLPTRYEQEILEVLSPTAALAIERKQREETLRETGRRLAAEIAALNRLHELTTRLVACSRLDEALDEMLDAAITVQGATMGTIAVYNAQYEVMEIVAQRGARKEYLDHFCAVRSADGSACGRAMRSGARVVIDDVEADPEYAPHRATAAQAGYRAVQATPLLSRGGELLGILCTHFPEPYPLSERDLRVLDLYARLDADFFERIRAETALRQADRRKEEFLAMLGHELRNPLATIHNAAKLLRLKGPTEPTAPEPEFRYARDVIDRQVQQLSRLVDDLLDASRISQGKITLKKIPVELTEVVSWAVETSRPLIEASGQHLTVVQPSYPLRLLADPARLAQVLGNLLNNAIKYSPQGSHITLSTAREGGEAAIHVRDTGTGIAAELLPTIFDMFVQADHSLDRSQGGLGIGLALVRQLVIMHGGRVEAFSKGLGQGSEFIVWLPLAEPPLTDLAPRPAGRGSTVMPAEGLPAPSCSSRRVVVVDDNHDGADSLALFLTFQGHQVRTAYDGPQALAAIDAFHPEVVLLDIGLPDGITGYDVARQLRRQPATSALLLIAMTGYGQEEDRRRSREAGFDAHLVKPADFAVLAALLER